MRRVLTSILGATALLGVLTAPAVADSTATAQGPPSVVAGYALKGPTSAAPGTLGTCPHGKPMGQHLGNRPSATRDPSCGENEVFDPIFNGCEPTLDNPAPICPPVVGEGGCRCAPGFIRESSRPGAKCVPLVPIVMEAPALAPRTSAPV